MASLSPGGVITSGSDSIALPLQKPATSSTPSQRKEYGNKLKAQPQSDLQVNGHIVQPIVPVPADARALTESEVKALRKTKREVSEYVERALADLKAGKN